MLNLHSGTLDSWDDDTSVTPRVTPRVRLDEAVVGKGMPLHPELEDRLLIHFPKIVAALSNLRTPKEALEFLSRVLFL